MTNCRWNKTQCRIRPERMPVMRGGNVLCLRQLIMPVRKRMIPMGKKKEKKLKKATVDIDADIIASTKKYGDAKPVNDDVTAVQDKAQMLRDMVLQYEHISKELQDGDGGDSGKDGSHDMGDATQRYDVLRGGVFDINDTEKLEVGEMILGAVATCVFAAGLFAVGRLGWKCFRMVRKLV